MPRVLDVSPQSDWIKRTPGYAEEPQLHERIGPGQKQFEPVTPTGQPLSDEEALALEITPEDIAAAALLYDQGAPPEGQGLPWAHTATPEEEAEIVEGREIPE